MKKIHLLLIIVQSFERKRKGKKEGSVCGEKTERRTLM
jgi:hypothetical protein